MYQILSPRLKKLAVFKELIVHDSITSTHLHVKQNHQSIKNGTVLIALEQTGGIGRGINTWISPLGGLYITFLFKSPSGFVKTFPHIAMLSLSIVNSFHQFQIDCQIKWPNDIYYGNRKISGILASGITSSNVTKTIILSAGVNLNNRSSFFPGISQSSTSFRDIKNSDVDIVEFAASIITHLDKYHVSRDYSAVFSDYNSHLSFKDRITDFDTIHGTISGKIIEVSSKGILIETGEEKRLIDYV